LLKRYNFFKIQMRIKAKINKVKIILKFLKIVKHYCNLIINLQLYRNLLGNIFMINITLSMDTIIRDNKNQSQ